MTGTGLTEDEMATRFCDVVMKGGVTSGVVYPKAVVTLAKAFRLRNIGGTSAGAIAAAAAAAAEFARRTGAKAGGYDLLAGLPDHLSRKNATGNTNLFTFFQPQSKTSALFDSLTAALESKSPFGGFLKILGRATIHFGAWSLLGLLPGLLLAIAEVFLGFWPLAFAWLGLGVITGLVAVAIAFVITFGKSVGGSEGNYFGLCTGLSTDSESDRAVGPSQDGQALTVWLAKYLNELAGLDPDGPPLTFGQLWNPVVPAGTDPGDGEKAICLEMFTTCLTKGRPFRLPFRDEDAVHENVCYFREDDWQRYFPANVVNWLKAHPRESSHSNRELPEGFYRMPEPWNLPVVVATRLSLSFPILLSAVRLWAYEYDFRLKDPCADSETPTDSGDPATTRSPSPCWFSDGGLCNNFPIHLFDEPLPRWPTFGINLVDKPDDTPDAEIETPWMPANNNQGIQEQWTTINESAGLLSIVKFIGAIIGTMQNWQDNALSRMPGYRDRIAQVGLRPSEGGLNLNMPKDRIEALTKRGDAGAAEFIRRFSDGEAVRGRMNWANHRWLRFRSLIASLEEMLQQMDEACKEPQPGDVGYEDWIRSLPAGAEPSYFWRGTSAKKRQRQRELAIESLARLRELAAGWERSGLSAANGAPRPRPELRPRPRI
jgi:predicted acylesterase/phospholipase RssA